MICLSSHRLFRFLLLTYALFFVHVTSIKNFVNSSLFRWLANTVICPMRYFISIGMYRYDCVCVCVCVRASMNLSIFWKKVAPSSENEYQSKQGKYLMNWKFMQCDLCQYHSLTLTLTLTQHTRILMHKIKSECIEYLNEKTSVCVNERACVRACMDVCVWIILDVGFLGRAKILCEREIFRVFLFDLDTH